METIAEQKLWSLLSGYTEAKDVSCTQVRADKGHAVSDYLDLATKVAELQFRNREYVLLFRGQDKDYKNTKSNTSLKPTLFRSNGVGNPDANELMKRFETLARAERRLSDQYAERGLLGRERLQRHRILRWSILQHYKVCETPLLDVTHSLRIAASFATHTAKDEAFVFVLGVPNLSGAVTASAEANLQIIRLSSVCPPSAIRPHIQEGYLLGEYPELTAYEQKQMYGHHEIDFGRRLVGKFRFNPKTFWRRDQFPKISRVALYPASDSDPLYRLTEDIRQKLH
jgi:hypothetical protein